MKKMPFSSYQGFILSRTTIIFVYVSFILRSEFGFLLSLLYIRYGKGRLDITSPVAVICDKVDFQFATLALSFITFIIIFHNSDIHIESISFEFIVDNILHDMVLFLLAEVELGIAQTDIGEIVFKRSIDVSFSLDVVLCRLAQDICLFETSEISSDCRIVDLFVFYRSESPFQLLTDSSMILYRWR